MTPQFRSTILRCFLKKRSSSGWFGCSERSTHRPEHRRETCSVMIFLTFSGVTLAIKVGMLLLIDHFHKGLPIAHAVAPCLFHDLACIFCLSISCLIASYVLSPPADTPQVPSPTLIVFIPGLLPLCLSMLLMGLASPPPAAQLPEPPPHKEEGTGTSLVAAIDHPSSCDLSLYSLSNP